VKRQTSWSRLVFWEANSGVATQERLIILRNPRVYYSVYKISPLAAAFIEISQLDSLRSYFLIHFNIVSFMSRSSQCLPAVGLRPNFCVHYTFSYFCYMSMPFNPPGCRQSYNIWWIAQISKFFMRCFLCPEFATSWASMQKFYKI